MKKIIIALLFMATTSYSAEDTQELQRKVKKLEKKVIKKDGKIQSMRDKSYLKWALAFSLGSCIRLTRFVSIPGAFICGLGVFRPTFLSDLNTGLSLSGHAATLRDNLWKIGQNSVGLLVKKTGDFANRLEKQNEASSVRIEQKESVDKK